MAPATGGLAGGSSDGCRSRFLGCLARTWSDEQWHLNSILSAIDEAIRITTSGLSGLTTHGMRHPNIFGSIQSLMSSPCDGSFFDARKDIKNLASSLTAKRLPAGDWNSVVKSGRTRASAQLVHLSPR